MLPIFIFLAVLISAKSTIIHTVSGNLEYRESWGYANVRPKAFMFWWLYYTDPAVSAVSNRPLYMWLQGGPGSSGTGFGNFDEMGPLDATLKPRNTTWLQRGDLLFVDNPVGTGFSYVTDNSAFTVNVQQISADLLTMLTQWFRDHPAWQKRPFYIISESYGGKMTAHFASVLYPAIQAGKIQCNFKGVGLGDSWISPIDFVNSWGQYLYYFSYLSDTDLARYSKLAAKCTQLVEAGQWWNATDCWDQAEVLVGLLTDEVSWYNVLKRGGTDPLSASSSFFAPHLPASQAHLHKPIQRLMHRHLPDPWTDRLNALMNGPIKHKLGIIPKNVSWGGQGGQVFQQQGGDFMKDVIPAVDYLLANTTLKVVIYNGQLDLICDTVGLEMWMKKLKWPSLATWRLQPKVAFHAGPPPGYSQTAGFVKKYRNLYFYWIMRAGHMVPGDAPYASLRMLSTVFI